MGVDKKEIGEVIGRVIGEEIEEVNEQSIKNKTKQRRGLNL